MDKAVLEKMITSDGDSVMDLSNKKPLLIVFLRHFGCIFCREALQDLSKLKDEILEKGGDIVFVHMANKETAEQYFKKYKLNDPKWVQDSECEFYQEFGLLKGTFNQLFGFKNWVRGVDAVLLKGNMVSWKQLGDGFQMPGVFLLDQGKIIYSFKHNSAADRPNYLDILSKVEKFKNSSPEV